MTFVYVYMGFMQEFVGGGGDSEKHMYTVHCSTALPAFQRVMVAWFCFMFTLSGSVCLALPSELVRGSFGMLADCRAAC